MTAATPVTEPDADSQSGAEGASADGSSTDEPDTAPSDGQPDPDEPDAGEPTTAELDTGDDAGCDQLLRDAATDPIPGSEFGRCLVAATTKADTAMVTTTYDDGTGGSGPMSFREPVELHFVLVEGGEILIREDSAWLEMGGSWVAADPMAGFEGEMAFAVTEIYRALTLPAAQTSYFAASEVWELVDEPNETIDGALTRGFAGSPNLGVVQVEQYEVWVDDDFLPRRIDATVSLAGQRVVSRQEFARWGEPVTIRDSPSS